MTLLQGVVNAFVMFLARILAYILSSTRNRSRNRSSNRMNWFTYYLFTYLFECIFLIFGMILIASFSRKREFRADRGGARLAGKEKMIAALQALKNLSSHHDKTYEKAAFQSLKISTRSKKGFRALFATHPPLEKRIQRLTNLKPQ